MTLGLMLVLGASCDSDGESVEITHPPPGAELVLPFEVTVETSVPLGAPGDGEHHLHLWFGDDLDSYLVVEDTTTEIVNAPPGEQEMHVSLRRSDHTAAGAETSVRLVISATSD